MTDESHDPSNPYAVAARAASAAAALDAGGEGSMGGWGDPTGESTWTEMGEGATESRSPGTGSRRPTALGLPPITQRTSDLRTTISEVLTTKAPTPLIRLTNRSTDQAEVDVTNEVIADVEPIEPGSESGEESPAAEPAVPSRPSPLAKLAALKADRPELVIGAAFAGGLLLATILKRLARR